MPFHDKYYSPEEIPFRRWPLGIAIGVLGLIMALVFWRAQWMDFFWQLVGSAMSLVAGLLLALHFTLLREVQTNDLRDTGFILPRRVAKALTADEKVVILTRKHWIDAAPETTALSAAVILAFLGAGSVTTAGSALAAILVGAVIGSYFLYQVVDSRIQIVTVTDRRALLFAGVFTAKIGMMPASKITDLSIVRPWYFRLLGIDAGSLIVESAGQDQALARIDNLPHIEEIGRLLGAQLR